MHLPSSCLGVGVCHKIRRQNVTSQKADTEPTTIPGRGPAEPRAAGSHARGAGPVRERPGAAALLSQLPPGEATHLSS